MGVAAALGRFERVQKKRNYEKCRKKRRAENYPRRQEIATNPLKSAQREKNGLHFGP